MTSSRQTALDFLKTVGAVDDAEINLFESCLQLAVLDYPQDTLQPYRDHLADLAAQLKKQIKNSGDGLDQQATALRQVMVEQNRYHGDSLTYDDLQNANLIRVIDRRMGLPITLGILFLVAGQQAGFDMRGINFPGHFLLRLEQGGGRHMLDPFHESQSLDAARLRQMLKAAAGSTAELTPEHYLPMTARDILLRLQNNIKLRHVQAGRLEQAIQTVEVTQLFAPKDATLWRELGLLQAALGDVPSAIQSIEVFATQSTETKAKRQAALILQQLKGRL